MEWTFAQAYRPYGCNRTGYESRSAITTTWEWRDHWQHPATKTSSGDAKSRVTDAGIQCWASRSTRLTFGQLVRDCGPWRLAPAVAAIRRFPATRWKTAPNGRFPFPLRQDATHSCRTTIRRLNDSYLIHYRRMRPQHCCQDLGNSIRQQPGLRHRTMCLVVEVPTLTGTRVRHGLGAASASLSLRRRRQNALSDNPRCAQYSRCVTSPRCHASSCARQPSRSVPPELWRVKARSGVRSRLGRNLLRLHAEPFARFPRRGPRIRRACADDLRTCGCGSSAHCANRDMAPFVRRRRSVPDPKSVAKRIFLR